jgi:hypothetical protein
VGSTEVRDRSSSRPLAMSVSQSTLGLEGRERESIIGYSASPSTCTFRSKSTSNRNLSDSDENIGAPQVQIMIIRGEREHTGLVVHFEDSLQGCLSVEVVCEMMTRLGCEVHGSGGGGEGRREVVHFARRRGEDGRRGRRGADERWDGVIRYEASSALSLACRREGRGEWEVEDGVRGSGLKQFRRTILPMKMMGKVEWNS